MLEAVTRTYFSSCPSFELLWSTVASHATLQTSLSMWLLEKFIKVSIDAFWPLEISLEFSLRLGHLPYKSVCVFSSTWKSSSSNVSIGHWKRTADFSLVMQTLLNTKSVVEFLEKICDLCSLMKRPVDQTFEFLTFWSYKLYTFVFLQTHTPKIALLQISISITNI